MPNNQKILHVELGKNSYPIYIGCDLLSQKTFFEDHIDGQQVMVVTNTIIAPLYLDKILELLDKYSVEVVILPDGEQHKTIETTGLIFDSLLNAKFDRSATLIALGGGVVGDITGFAAASYQRGINFIQVPTTLLSQVDSSVGGKTGVNHPLGKNMIGAFYQPQAVIIDVDTLSTLNDREFSAGMAEVIKYGLLGNSDFLALLEENIDSIMNRDTNLVIDIIYQSCQDKSMIVSQDELEKGRRALLNLGHTFGHGIENTFGYGVYLHGEAVSIGMHMASVLSQLEGSLSQEDVERIKDILKRANLPISIDKGIKSQSLIESMSVDKKTMGGSIRLVLLRSVGDSYITGSYSKENFQQVVSNFCQ